MKSIEQAAQHAQEEALSSREGPVPVHKLSRRHVRASDTEGHDLSTEDRQREAPGPDAAPSSTKALCKFFWGSIDYRGAYRRGIGKIEGFGLDISKVMFLQVIGMVDR